MFLKRILKKHKQIVKIGSRTLAVSQSAQPNRSTNQNISHSNFLLKFPGNGKNQAEKIRNPNTPFIISFHGKFWINCTYYDSFKLKNNAVQPAPYFFYFF